MPETIAVGSGRTDADVVAAPDVHALTVTVTLYVPEAAGVALAMDGFWSEEVNPLGPVQA